MKKTLPFVRKFLEISENSFLQFDSYNGGELLIGALNSNLYANMGIDNKQILNELILFLKNPNEEPKMVPDAASEGVFLQISFHSDHILFTLQDEENLVCIKLKNNSLLDELILFLEKHLEKMSI